MIEEKQLLLNYWNINPNSIDSTVFKNIEDSEEFFLDMSLYKPIAQRFNTGDKVRVTIHNNVDDDLWEITIHNKRKEIASIKNTYGNQNDMSLFKSSICDGCNNKLACMSFKSLFCIGDFISACTDSRIFDFIYLVLHAAYDYTLYKHRLKLKSYNAKKSEYNPDLFNTSPLKEDAKSILISYKKFPSLRDYLSLTASGNACISHSSILYDYVLRILFPDSENIKSSHVLGELELDEKVLNKLLAKICYNTLSLSDIKEYGGKEELDRLLVIQEHLDHLVPPSELVRILTNIIGNKLDNVNEHHYEEIVDEFNKNIIVEEPEVETEEVVLDEPEPEPVKSPEEVEAEKEARILSDKLNKLTDGFSVVELDKGYEIKFRYYDKIKCKHIDGKRTLRKTTQMAAVDILLDLQNAILTGRCENSKAFSIYKTLSIYRDNIESDYNSLLAECYDDITMRDNRIALLEKENKELRARLDSLLMSKSKEDNSITEEEDEDKDEIWCGELNHFLREAAKYSIKQWDLINDIRGRRAVKVLKDYISKSSESNYPKTVYNYLKKAFIDNESFDTRKTILNSIGLEVEKGNNNHYKIYPKNKKEYTFILPSTPSDHKSTINGIKKYIQIMFR